MDQTQNGPETDLEPMAGYPLTTTGFGEPVRGEHSLETNIEGPIAFASQFEEVENAISQLIRAGKFFAHKDSLPSSVTSSGYPDPLLLSRHNSNQMIDPLSRGRSISFAGELERPRIQQQPSMSSISSASNTGTSRNPVRTNEFDSFTYLNSYIPQGRLGTKLPSSSDNMSIQDSTSSSISLGAASRDVFDSDYLRSTVLPSNGNSAQHTSQGYTHVGGANMRGSSFSGSSSQDPFTSLKHNMMTKTIDIRSSSESLQRAHRKSSLNGARPSFDPFGMDQMRLALDVTSPINRTPSALADSVGSLGSIGSVNRSRLELQREMSRSEIIADSTASPHSATHSFFSERGSDKPNYSSSSSPDLAHSGIGSKILAPIGTKKKSPLDSDEYDANSTQNEDKHIADLDAKSTNDATDTNITNGHTIPRPGVMAKVSS